jgi:hypothetical protein
MRRVLLVILVLGSLSSAFAGGDSTTQIPATKRIAIWDEYADMMNQTARNGQRDVIRLHAREDLIKKHGITDTQLGQIIAQSPESIKTPPTPIPVRDESQDTEDCKANVALVCDAIIESTQYITVDDNGKAWSNITETTAQKLESKGLLELTDKYMGLFINAKYTLAQKSKNPPADDSYRSDKLIAFCQGKTKREIRNVLGPPDMVAGPSWYYRNMKIEDVDSGRMLDAMIIMFMGDTALTVSFTGM